MSPWPPAPPQRPGTNRSAIVSLVLGLLTPCAIIPGLVGVGFGIAALRQIKRTRESGTGLAIGGFAATGVWLVIIALGVVALLSFDSSPARDDTGEITASGMISVDDLATGDCLEELPGGDRVLRVPGVPCADPHLGQVYHTFDLPDGDWPGTEAVFARADDGCLAALEDFPDAYADTSVEIFYLYPTRGSWRSGDREVVCVAEYVDGPRTGSLLD